jgi:hypothetical protein
LFACEPKYRIVSPRAGIGVAVGIESLGEDHTTPAIQHLAHAAQAVVGEVLRAGAAVLGHQVQPMQVEDRLDPRRLRQNQGQRGGAVDDVAGGDTVHGLRNTISVAVVVITRCARPIRGTHQSILSIVSTGARSIAGQIAMDTAGIRDITQISTLPVGVPVPASESNLIY